MQVKMYDILAYTTFYNTAKEYKLPFKTAHKLFQISDAVGKEQEFYQNKLKEILDEYAQKDENGNPVSTEDKQGVRLIIGKENDCYNAINELQSLEVELPDITLSIDELDCIELTMDEMKGIAPFLN